jgi:hypothetical protein
LPLQWLTCSIPENHHVEFYYRWYRTNGKTTTTRLPVTYYKK